jgi:predicted nucleotide-binding protein (sugar kinase/HSP70/actin superfamily)
MKIGIPRALYYYYFDDFYQAFFDSLKIEIVTSPETNHVILENGIALASDEMCLSLKVFLGHVNYLKDKCDYVLIPRIDNYGEYSQTCTNFLALFDIINNIMNIKILNYNIDLNHHQTELVGLIKMLKPFKISKQKITKAYEYAVHKSNLIKCEKISYNREKLDSEKIKILFVGHPYNLYDAYIGRQVENLLKQSNVEIIYSNLFEEEITYNLSDKLAPNLYWKYSRENIGSISLCLNKVDGVIFLSTFPCGLDSLANELVMRKLKLPYLNIVIDQTESLSGIETRIESFIDIIKLQNKGKIGI